MTNAWLWVSPFLGLGAISIAMVLSALGACYGICKSGVGIASSCVQHPDKMMKALMPVIMAGILGIYGLVIGVLINGSMPADGTYEFYHASLHFAAGLCVGFGSLSAGYAIGDIGNVGSYAFVNNPKFFVMFVFLLIFAEILGLYGLITAIVLFTYSNSK